MTSNSRTGIRTWGIPFKRRPAPRHALNGEFPTRPMSEEFRANTFVITVLTRRKYAKREKFLLTHTFKMIFRLSCSQSKLELLSAGTMVLNNLFQCGVCANSCTSVTPLLHFHQTLIEKLYDVLKIYVFPYGFPKFACRDCLEKIDVFDSLISELLKGQEHFYGYKESMLHDIDTTGKKKGTETHHSLNCGCEICTEKCGLQLLADAIEQKEAEEMHHPDNSTQAPTTLIEPSTSTAKPVACKNKQLKCVYCPKTFSHRGDMNKHLRTHTGEEPFSCHICHRKFKHTSNLKRHLTVHSGDKPFQCDLCGKKFNRKDKMESHRKTRLCKKHSSQ